MTTGVTISSGVKTAFNELKVLNSRQFFYLRISQDWREVIVDEELCKQPVFWIKHKPPPPLTSAHFDWVKGILGDPTWMNYPRCAVCNYYCTGKLEHFISDENYNYWSTFRPRINRGYICEKEMVKLQFQCCDYFDSTYQVQKRDFGFFEKLSMDLLPYCFSFCDAVSLCCLSQTSQSMHNLIMSEPIWKKFSEQHFPHCLYDPTTSSQTKGPIICSGYKYATMNYTLFEKTKIPTSKNQEVWDYVIHHLPQDDCRYFVFRTFPEDNIRSHIIFILWAPENAKVKSKMICASTKDSVKKALLGITVEIGGTDYSELSWDEILERIKRY